MDYLSAFVGFYVFCGACVCMWHVNACLCSPLSLFDAVRLLVALTKRIHLTIGSFINIR